jgi:hypothetical protein
MSLSEVEVFEKLNIMKWCGSNVRHVGRYDIVDEYFI